MPSQNKILAVYLAGLLLGWLPMMIEGRSEFPSIGVLATAMILVLTGSYAVLRQWRLGVGFMWEKKFLIAALITSVSAGIVVICSIAKLARRIIR